jgi:hypothetical protein
VVTSQAWVASGGPKMVSAWVPAVSKTTVSAAKMSSTSPPTRWGRMKCQATPPGAMLTGTLLQSRVNSLPTASIWAGFRVASGLPGTSE